MFLPKNHRVNITRQSLENEQFKAIFLIFDRKFLHQFYHENEKVVQPETDKGGKS